MVVSRHTGHVQDDTTRTEQNRRPLIQTQMSREEHQVKHIRIITTGNKAWDKTPGTSDHKAKTGSGTTRRNEDRMDRTLAEKTVNRQEQTRDEHLK